MISSAVECARQRPPATIEVLGHGLALSFKPKAALALPVSPLSSPVQVLLSQRISAERDFIFGRSGTSPYSGFSKSKQKLDNLMRAASAEASPNSQWVPWRLHDLRRTARSLMSRANVSENISERVLNHAIPGIRGVYDRPPYLDEKRDALNALAQLILRIVDPTSNVVELNARPNIRRKS